MGFCTGQIKRLSVLKARHIILQLCLVLALMGQAANPLALLSQDDAAFARSYFCNLSEQAPSSDAELQLRTLFTSAGKDWPKDSEPPAQGQHCKNCVLLVAALVTPDFTLNVTQRFSTQKRTYIPVNTALFYKAQGPPLGGRAPPHFV